MSERKAICSPKADYYLLMIIKKTVKHKKNLGFGKSDGHPPQESRNTKIVPRTLHG